MAPYFYLHRGQYMTTVAGTSLQDATISIRVIRADGTIEDYGVVSFYHRNPVLRFAWKHLKFTRTYLAHKYRGKPKQNGDILHTEGA
jgi:hypothetical protein